MKKHARFFRLALVASIGFLFAVCDISGLGKFPVVAVTEIKISPETAGVERGERQNFTVTLVGVGNPPQGVTWTVEGAAHRDTGICGDGTLFVSPNEEAERLTVRALSAFNASVYGTVRVVVTDPPPEGSLAWQLARLRNFAQDGGAYIVEINYDEEITSFQAALPAGRGGVSVTLRGVGAMRNVRLSGNGNLFRVGASVTLILEDNVTLKGVASNNASLVFVEPGGSLIMNGGTKITGNTGTTARGAGVNVHGTFSMHGGQITGNVAFREGGGVFVGPGGIFAMHDGQVSDNTAAREGGGVFVAGMFAMYGGAISDNTAQSYTWARGGGVIVGCHDNGLFVMQGGVISGNIVISETTTWTGGGGVYVGGYNPGGGTFLMTDGVISDDNVARFAGNMADSSSPLDAGGTAAAWYGTFTDGIFTPLGYLPVTGSTIEMAGGVLQGIITITVTGIPVRYDNWARSVSLWDGLWGWSGSTTEWITGSSATFTVFARPGNFRIYFYLWYGDDWVEYTMRARRRFTAGVNTIPFSWFTRN